MDDSGAIRRATADAVVERRQVRDAVAAVAKGIEELHRETALLVAMAAHGGHGVPEPDFAGLRKRVAATRIKLEKAVAKLPEHLRGHGRIVDLRHAISSLEGLLPPADG
jgi:hypothetical protein